MKAFKIIYAFVLCVCSLCLVGCSSPKTKVATVSNSDDVIVSIYAYDGKGESRFGLMNLGHSFLSFENISSETVMIGEYALAPTETVTISTWCLSDHFGVWYNIESNYIKYHDKYNGRYSVSMSIKKEKLKDAKTFISKNNTWLPTKNCTNFSIGLWNKLCEKDAKLETPLIYTPKKLTDDIKRFETHEFNKEIFVSSKLGYFNNGEFVEFAFEKALEGVV